MTYEVRTQVTCDYCQLLFSHSDDPIVRGMHYMVHLLACPDQPMADGTTSVRVYSLTLPPQLEEDSHG